MLAAKQFTTVLHTSFSGPASRRAWSWLDVSQLGQLCPLRGCEEQWKQSEVLPNVLRVGHSNLPCLTCPKVPAEVQPHVAFSALLQKLLQPSCLCTILGASKARGLECMWFWLQSAVFSADQMLISDWEHNQGGWGGEEEATLDPTETTNLISH